MPLSGTLFHDHLSHGLCGERFACSARRTQQSVGARVCPQCSSSMGLGVLVRQNVPWIADISNSFRCANMLKDIPFSSPRGCPIWLEIRSYILIDCTISSEGPSALPTCNLSRSSSLFSSRSNATTRESTSRGPNSVTVLSFIHSRCRIGPDARPVCAT